MEIYNYATQVEAEDDAAARRKIMEEVDVIIKDCRSVEEEYPHIKSARLGLEDVRADLWYDLRELEQAINAYHSKPWRPLKGKT